MEYLIVNQRPVKDPRLQQLERLIAEDPQRATHELRLLIADEPLNTEAYRVLARAIAAADAQAGAGHLRTIVRAVDQSLATASEHLDAGDLENAERILRERVIQTPTDATALLLWARLLKALAYYAAAEEMLELALEVQPQFHDARIDLASEMQRQSRPNEALEQVDRVLSGEPGNRAALNIKAAALSRAGSYDGSLAIYQRLIEEAPEDASLWSSYGHVLKTVGRSDEGLQAMRKAVEMDPASGTAWWHLSNLKVARFSPEDLRQMEMALHGRGTSEENRYHLHFALGKAMEDEGKYEAAFRHYEAGNELRKRSLDYDPDDITTEVDDLCRLFTADFLKEREGWGCAAADPIFVLGMPRAGSTLVEQILASHSGIEGTMELSDLAAVARTAGRTERDFLDRVKSFGADQFASMGRQYLDQTRVFRLEGKPRFIDKMPNNWLMAPLIHLMLPNARIIDARRNPMACGFSNFKQHYAYGQAFSYDLGWFGRYYRDYVRLMAHVDRVLPGRVHRLIHEELVRNPDDEIRRLLDYVGVPFEESCLRFHETERAVKTPSAEQVRRPLSAAGLEQWRNFEPWLGELHRALGDVADLYPAVPDDAD
jgi:tetratricopeptide (TPR) repeat protein